MCGPNEWPQLDVDKLARLYDSEVTAVLDRLVPARSVTIRPRPSDPWFDQECRDAKRLTRQLERASRRANQANIAAAAAANAAWTAQRRSYQELLRRKREQFWCAKVDSERSSPRKLWRSIDALMGRGRVPSTDDISASEFHRFFDDKVAGVRASTADAPAPTFSSVPRGS